MEGLRPSMLFLKKLPSDGVSLRSTPQKFTNNNNNNDWENDGLGLKKEITLYYYVLNKTTHYGKTQLK